MPEDSTVVIRENAQLMVELFRIAQEVSFSSARLIFKGGENRQYYIQFLCVRDSPEIYGEAVGNVNLNEKDHLSTASVAELLKLGWQKPDKNSAGNYWCKWQVHTNRDRATVALTVMTTFLKIYGHLRGENLVLDVLDLGE
jgi:hypothetical protein